MAQVTNRSVTPALVKNIPGYAAKNAEQQNVNRTAQLVKVKQTREWLGLDVPLQADSTLYTLAISAEYLRLHTFLKQIRHFPGTHVHPRRNGYAGTWEFY